MLTVERDGWEAVRHRIWDRDGGCIAVLTSKVGARVSGQPCRDKWGIVIGYSALEYLELDHIKEQPAIGAPIQKRLDKHSYKAPDDEAHLVLLCPAHHRGVGPASDKEAVWATHEANRAALRDYLTKLYPEVWQHAA